MTLLNQQNVDKEEMSIGTLLLRMLEELGTCYDVVWIIFDTLTGDNSNVSYDRVICSDSFITMCFSRQAIWKLCDDIAFTTVLLESQLCRQVTFKKYIRARRKHIYICIYSYVYMYI